MKSNRKTEGVSGVLGYGLYKSYKKRFNKHEKKIEANVLYHQWSRICRKFNQRKMYSILNGCIFNMPFRLGSLGIVQFKRRIKFDENGELRTDGLVPDWYKTWLLWKEQYPQCETMEDFKKIKGKQVVFRTNEHTDGRIFKFHWKKKNCNIKNISAYEFIAARQYKTRLGQMIFANPNKQYCEKF